MKKTEHSELTFQAIVEATPNAIILVNKEGKITYANHQTEKQFGFNKIELIGHMVEILIPERYHQNHSQFRNMFFMTPETRAMGIGRELFALRKDGTEFPVEIGLNPLITANGTMVLVSIIDISPRKKAEERFRLVVESAPNAMILVNPEGMITLINNQTKELFGYQKDELIGNKLELLVPNKFREYHPHLRKSFFSSPSVRAMGAGRELFALRKDGTEFPVEIGLNPIETDEGTVVLASIIDITERKKHEAIVALELKNKELEQFNYIASHDLQEPLRTVINYIQILEEDFSDLLNNDAKNHLQTINRAVTRMSMLVRSLLDFSRLGQDKTLISADCNLIVENVIADLDNLIRTTGAKIIFKDLPVINVYETELRQLFQNLIHNAIKFSKKDVAPVINIACINRNNEFFEFSVADNGMGIAPQYYERIFHIFQRLNADREFEGNGIGLANCKKIAEMHGGKIWVESALGMGSTFKFLISNFQL
jgi:PAS domain S-box-containing protein